MECFKALGEDTDIRSVVLSGRGKLFTGGLDLTDMMTMDGFFSDEDVSRRSRSLRNVIQAFQQSFTQIEQVIDRCSTRRIRVKITSWLSTSPVSLRVVKCLAVAPVNKWRRLTD